MDSVVRYLDSLLVDNNSMNKKHFAKIKRLLISGLPSSKEAGLFIKGLILVMVLFTFGVIFNYTSTAHAQSVKDNAFSGITLTFIDTPAGCAGIHGFGNSEALKISTVTTTAGYGRNAQDACGPSFQALEGSASSSSSTGSNNVSFAEVDYGATGRVLNGGVSLYQNDAIQPGMTVEYYASKIRGVASAADNPTSGRSVLAPIFFLNQAMVNLAYALVAVVLVFSALNILISSLTGAEERFTLVQLLINAGVTLIAISFYYEIAAIIFDVGVNYGNSLVASIMSPFINSQVILDRLQPGGDLSIIAVINTFEFTGVSDGLLNVTQNIASGLFPAITQSSIAINKALTNNPAVIASQAWSGDFLGAIGNTFGLAGGVSSIGISYIVSNFLGNKEIFDAVIAWAVFFVNIKIFFNLLSSFLSFCIYTGFGPMIALGGITGGFEKISTSFKSLFALAAVFPLTFLLILLGATSMNMFIRDGTSDTVLGGTQNAGSSGAASASVLCKYSTADPQNTQDKIINRDPITGFLDGIINGDSGKDNPTDFRNRNYLNQRIFDVTPANKQGNVRDCRPSLFPVPFTFIPAPFGTIGNRQMQVQTIDSLVRTFLGIIFLILASRAPKILEEVLEVKHLGSLNGLVGAFKSGTESFFAVGGVALSVGLPLTNTLTKAGSGFIANRAIRFRSNGGSRLGGIGNAIGGFADRRNAAKQQREINSGLLDASGNKLGSNVPKYSSLGDIFGSYTSNRSDQFKNATAAAKMNGLSTGMQNAGAPAMAADVFAGQKIFADYDKLTKQMNVFGNSIQTATSAITAMVDAAQKFSAQASKLITLDILDQT